jgi:hypothetical protein
LTIEPAASADELAAVDFVWERGPIAGRLWYSDYVPVLEESGERETAVTLTANQNQAVGWLFWAVGEEASTDPGDPWLPRVYLLGPHVGMPDALAQALAVLEDRDRPTGTYDDSLREVEAMLAADPDYSLLPRPIAAAAGRWRRHHGAARARGGRSR